MMLRLSSVGMLVVLLAAAGGGSANDATLPDWTSAKATKVAEGLAGPMDIDFAPDGSLWYVEVYGGNVTRLDLATGKREVKFHVDSVSAFDERGLVGLALDPDFGTTGAFYIYYTKPDPANKDGGINRVSKVVQGQETVLLDNIPAFKRHNGGRIAVTNEGHLFISVGEIEKGTPSQDPASPLGKILRITRDGQPVPGNAQGNVFSLGHRNVYGLAVHPTTGQLFATENSVGRRDEVNLVEAGKNYGWPLCEGLSLAGKNDPCDDPRYTNPLMQFYANHTAAPTGAAFFLGQLLWASWNEGALHHLWWDDGTKEWRDRTVFKGSGVLTEGTMRIADVATAPDGRSVYFSTWSEVWRVEFQGLPPGIERGHFPPWWKPAAAASLVNQGSNTEVVQTTANGTETDGKPVPGVEAYALGALASAALALRARRRSQGKS